MRVTAHDAPRSFNLPEQAFDRMASLALHAPILEEIVMNLQVFNGPNDLAACFKELASRQDNTAVGAYDEVRRALEIFCTMRSNLSARYTGKQFYSSLTMSIQSRATEEWKTAFSDLWSTLEEPLSQLLDPASPISIHVKANQLSYNYSNLLVETHLTTDIRPAFDEDASSIRRASTSFVLGVDYQHEDQRRRVDIALDYADVEALRVQCERALKKAKTIRSALQGCFPVTIAGKPEVE